jgi:hypothetical protein
MSDYMKIWKAMARPPSSALKRIAGGRLSGMSDVNPQWRYEAMTEHFGACGTGWKFTIDKLWTEQGADSELFCFAQVSVYIKEGDHWSDPVPGIGGNFLIEKESKGLHNSDEGFKMAVTDALGTAMKMLGVAADVYAGLWDGTKYRDRTEAQNPASKPSSTWGGEKPAPPATKTWSMMSEAEKLANVVEKLAKIKAMSDPKAAMDELKALSTNPRLGEFKGINEETVRTAMFALDQDLGALLGG